MPLLGWWTSPNGWRSMRRGRLYDTAHICRFWRRSGHRRAGDNAPKWVSTGKGRQPQIACQKCRIVVGFASSLTISVVAMVISNTQIFRPVIELKYRKIATELFGIILPFPSGRSLRSRRDGVLARPLCERPFKTDTSCQPLFLGDDGITLYFWVLLDNR